MASKMGSTAAKMVFCGSGRPLFFDGAEKGSRPANVTDAPFLFPSLRVNRCSVLDVLVVHFVVLEKTNPMVPLSDI